MHHPRGKVIVLIHFSLRLGGLGEMICQILNWIKQQLLGVSSGSGCLILPVCAMLVVVYASDVESHIHFCTCVSTALIVYISVLR